MKMILDLDTGIDDALAIAYALGLPGVELIGVTNCFGNVTIDTAVQNTLDLLELLGHPEVPVFEGASCPWGADGYTLAPHKFKIHGQNGIGNVELPRAKAQKSAVSAVDFILDSARRYGPDLRWSPPPRSPIWQTPSQRTKTPSGGSAASPSWGAP